MICISASHAALSASDVSPFGLLISDIISRGRCQLWPFSLRAVSLSLRSSFELIWNFDSSLLWGSKIDNYSDGNWVLSEKSIPARSLLRIKLLLTLPVWTDGRGKSSRQRTGEKRELDAANSLKGWLFERREWASWGWLSAMMGLIDYMFTSGFHWVINQPWIETEPKALLLTGGTMN